MGGRSEFHSLPSAAALRGSWLDFGQCSLQSCDIVGQAGEISAWIARFCHFLLGDEATSRRFSTISFQLFHHVSCRPSCKIVNRPERLE